MPPPNTSNGSKFLRRTATGGNDRLNWSVSQRGITKANAHRAAETHSITSCNKIVQILMQKVIRSGVNLIKQTHGTTFLLCTKQQILPSQTFPHWEQHYPENSNETTQTTSTETQYSRLGKTYALKQFLSTRGQSNNFPARRTTPRLMAVFDTISRKWASNVNLETKVTLRIRRLYAFLG